ncbi:MAG: hypothetical protein P8L30_08805 [Longimicrobiales bacterium]|nr:hypothetical protein [Longimicrobiales bacterium]
MTKFRILHGPGTSSIPPTAGLTTISATGDLRVEAGPQARLFEFSDGLKILAVGTLVGRRTESGRLVSIESQRAFLSGLVRDLPPARWAGQIEGDLVLCAIKADGVVTLSGDRFFKRDVYLQQGKGIVCLASDLDLLPTNPAASGYDQSALAHTLTYYGHRPPKKHTIYNSVRRLSPGDIASVDQDGLHVANTPFDPVPTREYTEEDHGRYYEAFLDYLATAGSGGGNALFLSSGWDSTSILAGLVKVFGPRKVTGVIGRMTYSERSGNCNRFEIERAAAIAEYYGVRLHHVDLDYVDSGPDWIERVQGLFKAHNIQSQTGLNHARLAHGASEVAGDLPLFAGEISDGAHNLGFSQYVTMFHPTQGFREYSDKMAAYLFGPTFTRELLADRHSDDHVFNLFMSQAGDTLFDQPAEGRGGRMRQQFVSFFLRNGRRPLWSGRNIKMLTGAGLDSYTEEMASTYFQGVEDSDPDTLYSWYLNLYNSFHWQGSTVITIQKMADHFGMPAHNPYWDGGLQDFFWSMPESWGRGLDLKPTKYPLKRMMEEKLDFPMHLQKGPHSYTYDVDPDFNHNFELMHYSRLKELAVPTLQKKEYHDLLSPEVFDLEYLDGVVDAYVRGEEQRGAQLHDLVSIWLMSQSGWYR